MSWEAIAVFISILALFFTWLNEHRRKKAEASLIKLRAMEAYRTDVDPNRLLIHLDIANRHHQPIFISSLFFRVSGSRISSFSPKPGHGSSDLHEKYLRAFQAESVYWYKDRLICDLINQMMTYDDKWSLLRRKLYIAKNILKCKTRSTLKVEFIVGTNILENYKSNKLKIDVKPFRKEINKIIQDRGKIEPVG